MRDVGKEDKAILVLKDACAAMPGNLLVSTNPSKKTHIYSLLSLPEFPSLFWCPW
jgi:hypothetical protein